MNNHPEHTFVSQAVETRASTNGRKSISDFELTDLIQHIDENTSGDDDKFLLEFCKAVFAEFGWKWYSKIELDKIKDRAKIDFPEIIDAQRQP